MPSRKSAWWSPPAIRASRSRWMWKSSPPTIDLWRPQSRPLSIPGHPDTWEAGSRLSPPGLDAGAGLDQFAAHLADVVQQGLDHQDDQIGGAVDLGLQRRLGDHH